MPDKRDVILIRRTASSRDLGHKSVDFKKLELKTLKWWISRLMLDPLFFLISRLTILYL